MPVFFYMEFALLFDHAYAKYISSCAHGRADMALWRLSKWPAQNERQ